MGKAYLAIELFGVWQLKSYHRTGWITNTGATQHTGGTMSAADPVLCFGIIHSISIFYETSFGVFYLWRSWGFYSDEI